MADIEILENVPLAGYSTFRCGGPAKYFAEPKTGDEVARLFRWAREMNEEVSKALKRNNACYFAAIGGAGALYGSMIEKSELIAFPELLSEAVYRLEIKNFPLIVAMDSKGGSIYKR